MKTSNVSVGWCIWFVAVVVLTLATMNQNKEIVLAASLVLFPLTAFLVIRGIIRWTGRQWRHDANQGR